MIDITNVEVTGWEAAIRGMRNPMNSWNKSDTVYTDIDWFDEEMIQHKTDVPDIGPNDHDLMMKLAKAGSDHRKYLRMIHVSMDVDAPQYWWSQFDQYKIATVTNSTSKMHKLHAKEFELSDFSTDYIAGDEVAMAYLNETIEFLNARREIYNSTGDKDAWYQMLQMLPMSYNQLRTVDLNYEVLRNIYFARRGHKLDEWHTFCEWIETLPYHEFITEVE